MDQYSVPCNIPSVHRGVHLISDVPHGRYDGHARRGRVDQFGAQGGGGAEHASPMSLPSADHVPYVCRHENCLPGQASMPSTAPLRVAAIRAAV
jgi:hypothetical protein